MEPSRPPPRPSEKALASLNPAQRRAVTCDADSLAILAGPGSGKTHTLTSRVVWLVDRVGLRPDDVVVATFTVKAAREMKERIGRVLGDECGRRIVLGTFHSIARRYLAAYGKHIGLDPRFGIADDGDTRAIIQRICKRLQLAVEPPVARSWISKKKAKGTDPAPQEPKGSAAAATAAKKEPDGVTRDLETVYAEYQAQLARSNLLDYDDLLARCVELLRSHPKCVSNVQAVLIDEYQDTNGVQYELMKLMAQARRRITVVGDPDQSIYGWRSAEVRNLYRLLREFPRTREVALEENYRSSQAILGLALAVIRQDGKRYQKALKPVHARGARPVLRKLRTAADEGEWIVAEIRRLVRMTGGMLRLGDAAVLLRSAALSRHVESALGRAGIAYNMVGGFKFYDRVEIKVVLDYLRVVYQPDNNDAVARILNVPRRGIGDITVRNLLEEAEQSGLSLWSLLGKHCRGERTARTSIKKAVEQKLSGDLIRYVNVARKKIEGPAAGGSAPAQPYNLVDLITQLLVQIRLQKYLEENYPEDHEQRWANVQEFTALAADFVRDLADAAGNRDGEERRGGAVNEEALPVIDGMAQTRDADQLGRFLANVSLASDAQTGEKKGDASAVVTISTIHAAKGLEWPLVFVPAVYNGSIPHSRAEDPDEERRLLYVAMTRAKAMLYLSWPLFASQGGGQKGELSPFLPPDVASGFARKGPAIERPVVEDMAKILGRDAAPQEAIFRDMPAMSGVDDDLFPVDPEQESKRSDPRAPGDAGGRGHGLFGQPPPPPKRRRVEPAGEEPEDGILNLDDVEFLGRGDNYITVEQPHRFTISGFTTATQQYKLLAEKMAAEREQEEEEARERQVIRERLSGYGPIRSSKRPAGQRSLLGFVKRDPSDSAASRPPDHQPPPAIDPALASRQIPRGKLLSLVAQPPPVRQQKAVGGATAAGETATDGRDDDDGPRKKYAYFSSSPPPREPEDDGPPSSPPEPHRPAACLHVTTVMMSNRERHAPLSELKPLEPLEQLRMPFKPLTLNR